MLLVVADSSTADAQTIDSIVDAAVDPEHTDDIWVTLLLRNQALIAARGNTVLQAGDELLVTADDCCQSPAEKTLQQLILGQELAHGTPGGPRMVPRDTRGGTASSSQ